MDSLRKLNKQDIGNGMELKCTPELRLLRGRLELINNSYTLSLVCPNQGVRNIGHLKVNEDKTIAYNRTALCQQILLSKKAVEIHPYLAENLPIDCILALEVKESIPFLQENKKLN